MHSTKALLSITVFIEKQNEYCPNSIYFKLGRSTDQYKLHSLLRTTNELYTKLFEGTSLNPIIKYCKQGRFLSLNTPAKSEKLH